MSKGVLAMVLNGGRVSRFHTQTTLKQETVGEHSYLVAWIATMLMDGKPRAELLLACLAHDLPEHVLGDMPSPIKKAVPGLREEFRKAEQGLFSAAGMPDYEASLTPLEVEVLAFSDNMAGYLKCVYEREMGNTTLARVEERYLEYLTDIANKSEHLTYEACADMIACTNHT